jgi:hypothetical protein
LVLLCKTRYSHLALVPKQAKALFLIIEGMVKKWIKPQRQK